MKHLKPGKFCALAIIATAISSAAPAQDLPAGTTACDMGGYSVDPGAANVRASPRSSARILGKLPPPIKAGPKDEAAPVDGIWRSTFRIIGFKDGWFLIEKGRHPLDEQEAPPNTGGRSTATVKTFAGRGWIAGSLVGGQYANTGLPPKGALYAEPHADAMLLPAKTKLGAPIGADGGPMKVLACFNNWVKVISFDGVTGWWRTLCSNQVTNCS